MIDFALIADNGAFVEKNVDLESAALNIQGMTVSYGSEPAIYSVDFNVAIGALTAIIGPNGAGKSTLMNVISKSDVFAENKLFATLDTTVRKVVIKNLPFLVSDTVGFIRKLPTQLVESFKSTLDEVREADLLLHVVDISHHSFEDHIASVEKILGEINASDKPCVMVFNKIDSYDPEVIDDDDLITEKTKAHYTLEDWKQTWMNKEKGEAIFISAFKSGPLSIDNDFALYGMDKLFQLQNYLIIEIL